MFFTFCFIVFAVLFLFVLHDLFIHIIQICFIGTEVIDCTGSHVATPQDVGKIDH